jgi:tRNA pseudouridine55 synthase
MTGREASPDGLVVVDKPAGMTSHDVVARVRRLAGTRRVGHAGTLDPMATGVLVVGVGRATRLLGHLALREKDYLATVRLGRTTSTDDAEGEPLAAADVGDVDRAAVVRALDGLTGEIDQVPPAYSAIKVAGRRSYARARAGEEVELPPRRVTVHALALTGCTRTGDEAGAVVDVDLEITCSSGTYVRAIARDLGAALGCGGHLTALRRTRVGGFGLHVARSLDELSEDFALVPLGDAVAAAFRRRELGEDEARAVAHGGRLSPSGHDAPVGVFGPDGQVLALVEDRDGAARPLVVFVG